MKGSLIIIIFMCGLVISHAIHVVKGQQLLKGNGNIRVTKTCGSGRRKSASELKEIERKSIEKALKMKRMHKIMKPELAPSHKHSINVKRYCPRKTLQMFAKSDCSVK